MPGFETLGSMKQFTITVHSRRGGGASEELVCSSEAKDAGKYLINKLV